MNVLNEAALNVLVILGLLMAPLAAAQPLGVDPRVPSEPSVELANAALPTARAGMAAASVNDTIITFGGTQLGAIYADILRYSPSQDMLEVSNATLPTPRYGAAAIATGSEVIVLGGWNYAYHADILWYDPTTDTLSDSGHVLPQGNHWMAAAWDGDHAYLFGGISSSGFTDAIVRYTPATGEVKVQNATLPSPRAAATAAFADGQIYIFGGGDGSSSFPDVLRYDPATDVLTVLDVKLPTPRHGVASAVVDDQIMLMGGYDGRAVTDILRFNPSDHSLTAYAVRLHGDKTSSMAAAAIGRTVHTFGGEDRWDGTRTDSIQRITWPSDDGVSVHEEIRVDPIEKRVALDNDSRHLDSQTVRIENQTVVPRTCSPPLACVDPLATPPAAVSTPGWESPVSPYGWAEVKFKGAFVSASFDSHKTEPVGPTNHTIEAPLLGRWSVALCPSSCQAPAAPEVTAQLGVDTDHGAGI